MKTEQLEGIALDWAVAKCVGMVWGDYQIVYRPDLREMGYDQPFQLYRPSSNWKFGGPLIDEHYINIEYLGSGEWTAVMWDEHGHCYIHIGPTALIAAMRCFVASKLGDEIEVPDELIGEGL